jgi:hypothetical protein
MIAHALSPCAHTKYDLTPMAGRNYHAARTHTMSSRSDWPDPVGSNGGAAGRIGHDKPAENVLVPRP